MAGVASAIREKEMQHHALEQLPGLAYGINDNPHWGVAIVLGFQNYLTMVGTAVLIPLLIFQTDSGDTPFSNHDLVRVIQTVLFVSGINTLVQSFLGTRLPAVMGNSFYFLLPTISIVQSPDLVSIPDPHERFIHTMRATQGAFIAGSVLNIVLGFSGLWRFAVRFMSPIVIALVTTLVGVGLFEHGFTGVAKCVEIGIPTLLAILVFSQYFKYFRIMGIHIFEFFPIISGVAVVWVYALILTVAGAYDHATALGQMHCRTDRAGLVSAAPWVRVPYPLQWGVPTFDASNAFAIVSAAFVSLVESTGSFYAISRLAGATPPPPHVISRGIGWQGIGILLNGAFGTFTGATVAPENAGLIGLTRVGSRRVIQISAAFMIFFSLFGKFGGVVASIPQPIVAAILCITFGEVAGTGISLLQFVDMNFIRNIFIVGVSIFLGLTVPRYFTEYTTQAGHGPVHTGARWFNEILNVLFSSPVFVALIMAMVLDTTVTRHIPKRARGMLWTRKFRHFNQDPRNSEFYRLPMGLDKFLGQAQERWQAHRQK